MRVENFDSGDYCSAVFLPQSGSELPLSQSIRPVETTVAERGRRRKASRSHHGLEIRDERQPIRRTSQEIEPWSHLVTSSPTVPQQPPRLQWEVRTDKFFKSLPVSEEEWCRKRTMAGLVSEADLLQVYDELCGQHSKGHTASPRADTEGAGRKLDLSGLAKACSSAFVAGKLQSIIGQLLYRIFLATCIVASKKGYDPEDVDRAHRQYLSACGKFNGQGENTLHRERSTVLWELQEQQRQFRRGLLHRGFEIFIIGR
jgi:hypothetical protein